MPPRKPGDGGGASSSLPATLERYSVGSSTALKESFRGLIDPSLTTEAEQAWRPRPSQDEVLKLTDEFHIMLGALRTTPAYSSYFAQTDEVRGFLMKAGNLSPRVIYTKLCEMGGGGKEAFPHLLRLVRRCVFTCILRIAGLRGSLTSVDVGNLVHVGRTCYLREDWINRWCAEYPSDNLRSALVRTLSADAESRRLLGTERPPAPTPDLAAAGKTREPKKASKAALERLAGLIAPPKPAAKPKPAPAPAPAPAEESGSEESDVSSIMSDGSHEDHVARPESEGSVDYDSVEEADPPDEGLGEDPEDPEDPDSPGEARATRQWYEAHTPPPSADAEARTGRYWSEGGGGGVQSVRAQWLADRAAQAKAAEQMVPRTPRSQFT